jgi:hypothetical protein
MSTSTLLCETMIATKANNFPSTYRPRYLEERMRRSHLRQLEQQLDLISRTRKSNSNNNVLTSFQRGKSESMTTHQNTTLTSLINPDGTTSSATTHPADILKKDSSKTILTNNNNNNNNIPHSPLHSSDSTKTLSATEATSLPDPSMNILQKTLSKILLEADSQFPQHHHQHHHQQAQSPQSTTTMLDINRSTTTHHRRVVENDSEAIDDSDLAIHEIIQLHETLTQQPQLTQSSSNNSIIGGRKGLKIAEAIQQDQLIQDTG